MSLSQTLRHRHTLRNALRQWFDRRDYLEIDTPALVTMPGTEAYLEYFSTQWRDFRGSDHEVFLRSSPELHMKRALCDGLKRIYQFAPSYRNGGEMGPWHHPEFTMLEWYRVHETESDPFAAFVTETEHMLRTVDGIFGPQILPDAPLQRITVAEAIQEYAGIELVDGDPELGAKGKAKGWQSLQPTDDFSTAFFKLLLDAVEPGMARLGAAILLDYPSSQSALAQVQGGVAKRFEIYVHGVELCNGFLESTSLADNQKAIDRDIDIRRRDGRKVPPMDKEFIADLEAKGLPASCGNALGFDRLLALLLGDKNLDRAVPFRQDTIFKPDARR